MGWSITQTSKECSLLNGLETENFFYYVHSYRVNKRHKSAVATCNYGGEFTAIVEEQNLYGTQFHPEKSHHAGLKIIENFINMVKKA